MADSARNGTTNTRERQNWNPPRRGNFNTLDGGRPCGYTTACYELQTHIHDHLAADRVAKNRSPGRVNQHMTKGICNVYAAETDPSAGTARLPQEQHS